MARHARTGLAALAACLLVAAPASAERSLSGWDGANPFECQLQDVGFGTDFPDPGADPFCVEFDKRRQNITEGGFIDFLLQEPARVAAALDKCFYYQHDHWTGWVVQDDETTRTYSWDGSYFFDKAIGAGGVYVENFSFNGQMQDPTQIPGFPEEYKPFFGPGRGGVRAEGAFQADPRCKHTAPVEPPPYEYRCTSPSGSVGRGIGGVRLGSDRGRAE